MKRLGVLLALIVVAVVGCSKEQGVLETKEARIPSDAGIATDMTLDSIQLDGKRRYDIDENVESFATRSHRITPLLSWEGKYVQVGLTDEKNVRWVAGIGIVSGKPGRVTYSGIFESFDSSTKRATFEDGTVLEFAPSVKAPAKGRQIVVEIDVAGDRVVRLLG